MDKITVCELDEWLRAQRAFSPLDVRRERARSADCAGIAGARWLPPENLFTWKDNVPRDRPAVLFCAHGHEISQGAAATLRAMGLDARYPVDGFSGWRDAGRPIVPLS